jgi:O-antigen/teichoic acid export membrane protein
MKKPDNAHWQRDTVDDELVGDGKLSDGHTSPSRRKAALTQVVLGYVSVGISVLLGLVMVPMYLRHINGRLYGLWLASGGVIVWLGMLDLGVASLMGQRIAAAYGRKDYREVGCYYFNSLIFQIILMLAIVVAATGIAWVLPPLLGARTDEKQILSTAIFLACLYNGFTFMNNGQHNTAGALQRPFVTMSSYISGGMLAVLVTIKLLFAGHGLVALPVGMLTGALFTFLVDLFYVTRIVWRIGGRPEWNRRIFSDILRLSPAILAAKIGNALVGKIEPTLISIMITPEAAIAFTLTKRAADVVQMVLDRIVGSVMAGFAHLYAEGDKRKAADVLDTLCTIFLGVGVVCLASYVALNRSFVGIWVGERYFAGSTVTVLVALSIISLVFSNLFSMLLGATGDIAKPCVVSFFEAVFRLLLMGVLLPWVGLAGLPLVVTLSAGGVAFWFLRRLRSRLGLNTCLRLSAGEGILLGVVLAAAGAGALLNIHRWSSFGFALAIVVGLTAAAVAAGQPRLRTMLKQIVSRA